VTASGSEEDLLDHVADLVLRGEDPNVEGLIAARTDITAVTASKLRKLASAFGPRKTGPFESAAPFTQLGPYRILSRLGEGGMGVVYVAEHEFLARRVALKVIRPELTLSPVTRRRFRREAVSIAALRHANIVTVYDAGELDGIAYLAMELIEGNSLGQRLESARLAHEHMDPTAVARHARDVALALQCAHEAGIVHRDVKPSNVIVTADDRALLLDFGLCLTEDAAALSAAGLFRGTPQYASPEQLEADALDVDARTDVYSLGMTMYECLTGRVPFEGDRLPRLFHRIVTEDPPAPRDSNAAVDAGLSEIVMRALAKRREDRFQSAGEMARALDVWLEASNRSMREPRRRVARAAAIAGVVVLAVGTIMWRSLRTDSVAAEPAQLVARFTPRSTLPLFGPPQQAFRARLEQWETFVGPGSFGSDEDGPGVVGVSVMGITAQPRALAGESGCVSGRIEPMPLEPGAKTRAAGVGVEFSNGRMAALLLDASDQGYALVLHEIVRDPAGNLLRGPRLASGPRTSELRVPTTFTLSWNGTDTQFDCGDRQSGSSTDTYLVPRALRAKSPPSRLLLLVEDGTARFESWVLEQ
jgi:tRNA A-37 threonylcarbamoyl transferase component Bud32